MDRRLFLCAGTAASVSAPLAGLTSLVAPSSEKMGPPLEDRLGPTPPAFAIIPVVGDGKWIWTKPPENSTGYLEARPYDLKIGIDVEGRGASSRIKAATAAPVQLPEQKIEDVRLEKRGCNAVLRQLAPEAGQLLMTAPRLLSGQKISALAHFRITLHKVYQGYRKEQFPGQQEFPANQRRYRTFRRLFLTDSPGIQTRLAAVRKTAEDAGGQFEHPWDKAQAYYEWVWKNIKGRLQKYTSVGAALRKRIGDCEERAAVFVALCRAAGIPARLVWVPNHNWAEFYLYDHQGQGHWIPAHTAAYSWFGWTGAHELVLQKGDKIVLPEKRREFRLLGDWMQHQGGRPQFTFWAELRPLPPREGGDPGPGARRKDKKGQWRLLGKHKMDKFARE